MFKEMGIKTFYIGKSLDDPKRTTVMFQGSKNVLFDIFVNPEKKPIVDASGHTFEEYEAHMNAPEQQAMFKEMGVKTFYIGKSIEEPTRATVMFQGPENVLYDIFKNPETKSIVEASGHIYELSLIHI